MSLYALKLNNARVDWLIVGGSGRYGIPPNINVYSLVALAQ